MTTGIIQIDKDINNSISLKVSESMAGHIVLVLPPDTGTAGQVLSTDGSGNLTWITI